MAFTQAPLPYDKTAFPGILSPESFEYHYGKHHAAYVNNLNNLLAGTPYLDWGIEDLIANNGNLPANLQVPVFNNAAQHWNHTFFWNCLSPNPGAPSAALSAAILAKWGTMQAFQDALNAACVTHFGSGWGWLVKNADGTLEILSTHDAGTPLTQGKTALLTFDVWEHAYYIDYRNARATFCQKLWPIVNWNWVNARFGA